MMTDTNTLYLQKSVRESRGPADPDGAVAFDVVRAGTEGVVDVEWRLSPDAVADFVPPLTGIVTFGPVGTAGQPVSAACGAHWPPIQFCYIL